MKDYFKDYNGWSSFLYGKKEKKICHKTMALSSSYEDRISLIYHNTILVSVTKDGYLVKNNGWETVTTKKRINQFTPPGFHVFQRDWEWYMKDYNQDVTKFSACTIDNLGRFIEIL